MEFAKRMAVFFALFAGVSRFSAMSACDNFPFGGRSAGMGNAMVAVYDFWAGSHNQAGLAHLNSPTAGIYFENRFLSREMGFGAAAVGWPSAGGVFEVSITHFGYSMYHESKVGLAYARSFGDKFSAGVQLNYFYTYIGESYGASGVLATELGLLYELLPGLDIGFHLFNPTLAKMKGLDGGSIPTVLRLGMAYHFSKRVLLSLETAKELDNKPILRLGLEYLISPTISLRMGTGTRPTTNAFGFGITFGKLHLDLASSFHYVLGYSPQASLVYVF